MSLRFFFHPKSLFPKLLEVLGLFLLGGSLGISFGGTTTACQDILLGIITMMTLFIWGCALKRWYPGSSRHEGIGKHFTNIVVALGYILTFSLGCFLLTKHALALIIGFFPVAFITYVNAMLLWLHAKDDDTTPVNFYSAGKYLREDPASKTPRILTQ